jgi:hypothetical protein
MVFREKSKKNFFHFLQEIYKVYCNSIFVQNLSLNILEFDVAKSVNVFEVGVDFCVFQKIRG